MSWVDNEDFKRAERVQARDYVGWVVWPDGRDRNDYGFFSSVEVFMHELAGQGVALPPFVWATLPYGLTLDAREVVRRELDDSEHHDDAIHEVSEEAFVALQEVLDAWLKRPDVRVCTYEEDHRYAVVFDDADRARYEKRCTELREAQQRVLRLLEEAGSPPYDDLGEAPPPSNV